MNFRIGDEVIIVDTELDPKFISKKGRIVCIIENKKTASPYMVKLFEDSEKLFYTRCFSSDELKLTVE